MIYKSHYIELYVNGEKCDIESQKSLNLRFNNVIYDPEKVSSTQAEYSFEFELPSTPNNDRIFDYANNLAKANKFHKRWNAEVYADGSIIFKGSLTLNGFKDKKYRCNLVSVKVYSLDDIFGDKTMNDIKWEIEFDGAGTTGKNIYFWNSKHNSEVTFPLISYGAFQKSPMYADSVANDYTSKFLLDKYNRWYIESFYPSPNMLETIKKAFEGADYKIGGDMFEDEDLKKIYMSINLADGQVPTYNLGNPKFGSVNLRTFWFTPESGGTTQELKYPYLRTHKRDDNFVTRTEALFAGDVEENEDIHNEFNFKSIKVYDMLSSAEGGDVYVDGKTYLYDPVEQCIVIPADGFYKIEMDLTCFLNESDSKSFSAMQWTHDWRTEWLGLTTKIYEKEVEFHPDFKITTPLEVQLVRNYDDDVELIKGKRNIFIHDGYPDHTTEGNRGHETNYTNWVDTFPHQQMGMTNEAIYMCPTDKTQFNITDIYDKFYTFGTAPNDGELMCYDPVINPNFIMGITSMGNEEGVGTSAVIKNGYSWSKQYAERSDAMYTQNGYVGNRFGDFWEATTINKNTYPDCPNIYFNQTKGTMTSHIVSLVHLNRNDKLRLLAIQRDYTNENGDDVIYNTQVQANLKITAESPNSYSHLRSINYGYNSEKEFPVNLQISEFLNKEKKISEWMQNIFDAFNIEMIQDGKSVFLNKRRKIDRNMNYAVDIDDRCNSANAESSAINYPKSMSIKYKIDSDEWGFERSAVENAEGDESILNDDDWKKYAESGYTVITLNDDSYVTTKSEKNLQLSYTWYDNFTWTPVDSAHTETSGDSVTLRMPVISKYSYMIDGYDYDESMKHDGYGLSQRFWFKPEETDTYVYLNSYPTERVDVYIPKNEYNGLNLSYKDTEKSLLIKYFNITPYLSSNYVKVDVYLTPEEYNSIKNGAMVKFDDDLYYPVEISGYDASGNNTTEIKMMKKII